MNDQKKSQERDDGDYEYKYLFDRNEKGEIIDTDRNTRYYHKLRAIYGNDLKLHDVMGDDFMQYSKATFFSPSNENVFYETPEQALKAREYAEFLKEMDRPRILIVKDDKFLADIYGDRFIKAGYRVKMIYKPDQNFIGDIIAFNPDMIVLGLLFPNGIDGFQLIKSIRNDEHTKDMKVIAFDNWSSKEDLEKIAESGFDEYLEHKKFTPQSFVDYIDNKITGKITNK